LLLKRHPDAETRRTAAFANRQKQQRTAGTAPPATAPGAPPSARATALRAP
jgi:hypothetical protein